MAEPDLQSHPLTAPLPPPPPLVDHAAGSGPTLLLVHGGLGSHRHWARVITPLSASFAVHAPDLPGFGDSPDVPDGPDNTDGNAYVALAARSLLPLLPDGPVHLVGFSFGGAVAAGIARVWGARVARLTLIAPGGFGPPDRSMPPVRNRKDTDGSEAALREVARHNLSVTMLSGPDAVDDAAVDIQRWNLQHTRYDSLKVSHQRRVLDDIAHIAAPLQMIWGERDVFAQPTLQSRAAQILAIRPDATIDIVSGAGHWCQYECPDAVVRMLQDFHAPATATATTTATPKTTTEMR